MSKDTQQQNIKGHVLLDHTKTFDIEKVDTPEIKVLKTQGIIIPTGEPHKNGSQTFKFAPGFAFDLDLNANPSRAALIKEMMETPFSVYQNQSNIQELEKEGLVKGTKDNDGKPAREYVFTRKGAEQFASQIDQVQETNGITKRNCYNLLVKSIANNTVDAMRPVSIHSLEPMSSLDGMGKPMYMKGKSSVYPGIAGFIPADQRLSGKVDSKELEHFQSLVDKALKPDYAYPVVKVALENKLADGSSVPIFFVSDDSKNIVTNDKKEPILLYQKNNNYYQYTGPHSVQNEPYNLAGLKTETLFLLGEKREVTLPIIATNPEAAQKLASLEIEINLTAKIGARHYADIDPLVMGSEILSPAARICKITESMSKAQEQEFIGLINTKLKLSGENALVEKDIYGGNKNKLVQALQNNTGLTVETLLAQVCDEITQTQPGEKTHPMKLYQDLQVSFAHQSDDRYDQASSLLMGRKSVIDHHGLVSKEASVMSVALEGSTKGAGWHGAETDSPIGFEAELHKDLAGGKKIPVFSPKGIEIIANEPDLVSFFNDNRKAGYNLVPNPRWGWDFDERSNSFSIPDAASRPSFKDIDNNIKGLYTDATKKASNLDNEIDKATNLLLEIGKNSEYAEIIKKTFNVATLTEETIKEASKGKDKEPYQALKDLEITMTKLYSAIQPNTEFNEYMKQQVLAAQAQESKHTQQQQAREIFDLFIAIKQYEYRAAMPGVDTNNDPGNLKPVKNIYKDQQMLVNDENLDDAKRQLLNREAAYKQSYQTHSPLTKELEQKNKTLPGFAVSEDLVNSPTITPSKPRYPLASLPVIPEVEEQETAPSIHAGLSTSPSIAKRRMRVSMSNTSGTLEDSLASPDMTLSTTGPLRRRVLFLQSTQNNPQTTHTVEKTEPQNKSAPVSQNSLKLPGINDHRPSNPAHVAEGMRIPTKTRRKSGLEGIKEIDIGKASIQSPSPTLIKQIGLHPGKM